MRASWLRAGGAATFLLVSCSWLQQVFAGHADDSGLATTLTADTFDGFLTAQREKQRLALVMFHVGWCKVCQKTFPKFVAAAGLLADQEVAMDFAHVDCTNDKTLCKRFDVKGYPTIKLFSQKADAVPLSYRSQRSEEGFVKYAKRMTTPPVRQIASSSELLDLLRSETFSAFVAMADDAGAAPASILAAAEIWRDRHIFAVGTLLQELLPQGVATPAGAQLAVISSGIQQWPGADNTTKASPSVLFYDGDLGNATAVGEWVERSRFPGVWSLGEATFYAFSHASRRTAMIAVDPEQTTAADEKALRTAAAKLADDFIFGVLDGVSWAEELADFNIARRELPRVIVSVDDFDGWYEDVDELKLASLEEDLKAFLSGEKQLLRQGRSVTAKIMYYKREAWRYMVMLHAYSARGPTQAFLALCMVVAGVFAVMAAGWCMMSCCNVLMADEQDIDFTPISKAQARRPKKD